MTMALFNQKKEKNFIVTLKLNQSLRKFICRKLRVSLLNAASLKEIEGVVFAYPNFKVPDII